MYNINISKGSKLEQYEFDNEQDFNNELLDIIGGTMENVQAWASILNDRYIECLSLATVRLNNKISISKTRNTKKS